ncbi:MAG: hypothetical protein M1830_006153 [Pleopsidium flavum]|nr:MAG: hypothetical protein M1830_006153 [Pleopsidium flavum]
MAAFSNPQVPRKRKTFVPLDDPELLAFIDRPAYALLFHLPPEVYGKARNEENASMVEYEGSGDKAPVV